MNIKNYCYEYVELISENDAPIFNELKNQGLSERFIKSSYYENRILINENEIKIDKNVSKGDSIKIYYKNEIAAKNEISSPIDIIYENCNYLVINKKAPETIHPSFYHQTNTTYEKISHYFYEHNIDRKVRIVNRLDSDTSGTVLVSKNQLFHQQLSLLMNTEKVTKKYIAIVSEELTGNGSIEKNISKIEDHPIKRKTDEKGAYAVTKYETIISNGKYSLVKLRPITGRTHQLRVHLSSIGNPILGDTLYGNESEKIDRPALHSYSINFSDPFTNEYVEYISKIPDDMRFLILDLFNVSF